MITTRTRTPWLKSLVLCSSRRVVTMMGKEGTTQDRRVVKIRLYRSPGGIGTGDHVGRDVNAGMSKGGEGREGLKTQSALLP
jgi:hypothetical protein